MPRIRSIKPEFWSSPDIAGLSIGTRLTFIGMWNFAEDNGVGLAHELLLAASLFPMDDHEEAVARVRRALDELSRGGQITVYETSGKRLFCINSWHHQKIDRPAKQYRYETPDECTHTLVTCEEDGSSMAQLMLVEPSTSPRSARASGSDQGSGSREGTGEGTPAADAAPPKPPRRKPEVPLPSSWKPNEKHETMARGKGLDLSFQERLFRNHADTKDRRTRDWDAAFRNWLEKAWPQQNRAAVGDSHCEAWR